MMYCGPSWSWLYGSWIYNYLCNQCLSPLKLWVRTPFIARCFQYNFMWLSLSVTCDKSVVFSGFLHQQNWPPWYHWNIVQSGVKHHKPNQTCIVGDTLIEISDLLLDTDMLRIGKSAGLWQSVITKEPWVNFGLSLCRSNTTLMSDNLEFHVPILLLFNFVLLFYRYGATTELMNAKAKERD